MTQNPRIDVRREVEAAIERYVEQRRQLLDAFLRDKFSFTGTMRRARVTFARDVVKSLLNFALAVPSLVAKKLIAALQHIGRDQAAAALAKIPLSFKTEAPAQIERALLRELLELLDAHGTGNALRRLGAAASRRGGGHRGGPRKCPPFFGPQNTLAGARTKPFKQNPPPPRGESSTALRFPFLQVDPLRCYFGGRHPPCSPLGDPLLRVVTSEREKSPVFSFLSKTLRLGPP